MALRPGHAVDHHPDRQRIIDDIVAGSLSLDEIGRKYGLAKNTIWKYRRDIITPTLRRVTETAQALQPDETACVKSDTPEVERKAMDATAAVIAADPILARMKAREEARRRVLDAAESKEDYRAWSALDRNDLTALELEARLTGRLDSSPASSTTTIAILMPVAALPAPPTVPQIEAQDVEFRELQSGEPTKPTT